MTSLDRKNLPTIAAAVCFALASVVGSAQTLTVVQPANHIESPPLSSISGGTTPVKAPVRIPNHPLPLQVSQARTGSNAGETGITPALQTSPGPLMNVTAGTDFEAMRMQDGGYISSDNSIAVGPNHIVQTLNAAYTIYSKSGARLLGPNSLSSLWAGLGGQCAANNGGDPAVQYDRAADRWIITQLASLSSPYAECIAVSKTGDPTDAYNLYSYSFNFNLNGDPRFGVWPTATNSAYLASYNLFANGASYAGAEICAYDRAGMLAGAANPVSLCFTGINGASYLPADLDGPTPPLDGTPAYFADLYSTGGSLGMYSMSVDFGAQTAVLSPFSTLAVDSFSMASSVPQPGTSVLLDSLGDRLTYRLAFRMLADHESMVVTHSVAAGGAGIRWYELRAPVSTTGSFILFQQGTFAPGDGDHRWMGSAAMDGAGDIELSYSASSSVLYPALRYTGRTPADPAGTMESEASIGEGSGSGTGSPRWDGNSSVRIDPSDDCTFWHVSEGSGAYTHIGSFKFSGCGRAPAAALAPVPATVVSRNGLTGRGFTGPAIPSVSGTPTSVLVKPRVHGASYGPSKVGIFREGFYWLLDVDGNMQWDSPPDVAFAFGGIPGDIPISGDWTGDGYTKVGIYRPSNGLFILDSNGDDQFDAGDSVYNFLSSVGGPQPGDIPVVGDWSGSGTTKVGIFRAGFEWILDYNGDGVFDQGDVVYQFGGVAGDVPVVGDWTGTGTSKIGVLRDGFYWILDANGNGMFDGTGPGQDLAFAFGGIAGDVPVVGDWTGDGVSKVGMFRDGFFWVWDANDPSLNGGGPAALIAFAFGGIAGDKPVVGRWFSPPASITAMSGTPQSFPVNTAFPQPLAVKVIDSSGNGISGLTVTFTAPGNGASLIFAGGVNTAVTNASGVATSAALTANGTAGSYTVTASVTSCGSPYPGCPGTATPAGFSMTNTIATGGAITVGNAPPGQNFNVSVGQNLEVDVLITFATPTAANTLVTVTSSNPSEMLIVGQGGAGVASLTFTLVAAGQNSTSVSVQGVASSGTATLTASSSNYNPGSGTVTSTPSGFLLSGPNGIGVPSFSAGQGTSTTLTVTVARLDSSFNYAESQTLAPSVSANVSVTSSLTGVGTISSSPLSFTSGVSGLTTQFNAVAVGSTTLTAVVPTGFSTPANSGNVLAASVTPAGLVPANTTVGKGLETNVNVALNGVASGGSCNTGGGLTVNISSNNTQKLLLAVNPTDTGSGSISLCINGGSNHTQDFYVYGLANSGSATYTATAAGFGSANGTVTLAPSGFVLAGPFGLGVASFPTSTLQPPSTLTIFSAQLDSGFNYVGPQAVAGGSSVNINVTSGNTSVGTITTPTVNIAGGASSATTRFQPANVGNSVISVGVPAGFSPPGQDTTVTANVSEPGFGVTDGISIGNNLETQASVVIGQLATGGGQQVLLTSNNPSQLLLSTTATGVGHQFIMVTIPSGSNNTEFYLQAFGSPSTATYTASATGFQSRSGTITVTASAVVISGPNGQSPFDTTTSSSPTSLTVSMAQLDGSGNFASTQPLAGGLSLMVSLGNTNSSVATAPASVTIMGGSAASAAFTPVSPGQATISVVTPAGYTTPPMSYGSITGIVTM